MSTWKKKVGIFFALLLLVVVVIATFWVCSGLSVFPRSTKPGSTYKVGDREYTVPYLPHAELGSKEKPSLDSKVPVLSERTLKRLRQLLIDSLELMETVNVPCWVTGGTLISALLWKDGLMCFDDDADMACPYEYREYLWSDEFRKAADLKGLETIYLRGASLSYATREGSAVRLRAKGTYEPVVDIFFVKDRGDGTWAKVNTWNGSSVTYNDPKEVWADRDWIFPVHHIDVDGINCPVANKGMDMLVTQYGPNVDKFILSPSPFTKSHTFIHQLASVFRFWVTKPLAKEDDIEKLKCTIDRNKYT